MGKSWKKCWDGKVLEEGVPGKGGESLGRSAREQERALVRGKHDTLWAEREWENVMRSDNCGWEARSSVSTRTGWWGREG
eukprot:3138635-Rhodomonas_salina.7